MILEALNYAATWPLTPVPFRPFIRSSVSLWSRANRCSAAWHEHEQNCHATITGAVHDLKQRRTCVVLGSGLLRDVPARFLSRSFDTVVLCDLVHLATVRARIRAMGLRNLPLIHRDLSGFDDALAGRQPEPLAFLRSVPYLDLVISANLLSQIGVGAQRRIERDAPSPSAGGDIPGRLIAAHLDGLKGLTCPALLLTDTGFEILNRQGVSEDASDLMHGVALPEHQAEWTWPVAPVGEISATYELRHRVVACRINWPRKRGEEKS